MTPVTCIAVFQFYDSPIKSSMDVIKKKATPSFNSMIVRLKAARSKRAASNSRVSIL